MHNQTVLQKNRIFPRHLDGVWCLQVPSVSHFIDSLLVLKDLYRIIFDIPGASTQALGVVP